MKPQFRETEELWLELIRRKTRPLQFPPYSPVNYVLLQNKKTASTPIADLRKSRRRRVWCAGRPWDPISICIGPRPRSNTISNTELLQTVTKYALGLDQKSPLDRPPGIDCLAIFLSALVPTLGHMQYLVDEWWYDSMPLGQIQYLVVVTLFTTAIWGLDGCDKYQVCLDIFNIWW